MADCINVKISELYDEVKQMMDDGMETVELTILDEQLLDDGDRVPLSLWLSASSKDDFFDSTDYDSIYATEKAK